MKVISKICRFIIPAIFLVLYALTAQRGVSWQDSGVYQWRILYCDLIGVDGLSCAHPAYILINRILCGLMTTYMDVDLPFAANLCSAFWMGLALCVFQRIAFMLTKSSGASILATLTLGGAHMVWWLSTITEIYTLTTFILACETWCAISALQSKIPGKSFLFLPFFAGLGFAVHNFALISLPLVVAVIVYVGFIRDGGLGDGSRAYGKGFIAAAWLAIQLIFFWCCGAFSLLRLMSNEWSLGTPLMAVIFKTLFGEYGSEVMGLSGVSWKLTLVNLCIALVSFAMPTWLFFAIDFRKSFRALCSKWRNRLDVVYILILFVLHGLFFVRYRIADQALFILPTLFFAALLLSLRMDYIVHKRIVGIATILCAVVVPIALNAILHFEPIEARILASRARLLPYRDEVRYWTIPWKHNEYSAELFAEDVIERMDKLPGKKLFADTTSAPPIMLRLSERRQDWELCTPWNDHSGYISTAINGETVFAISPIEGYCLEEALKSGNVLPLFNP